MSEESDDKLQKDIEGRILNSDYWHGDETTVGDVVTLTAELISYLKFHTTMNQANLGYATTKQLLEELATRLEVTQNSISGRELAMMCRTALEKFGLGVLNYSTMKGN